MFLKFKGSGSYRTSNHYRFQILKDNIILQIPDVSVSLIGLKYSNLHSLQLQGCSVTGESLKVIASNCSKLEQLGLQGHPFANDLFVKVKNV